MKRALVVILVVLLLVVGGFLLYVTVKPLGGGDARGTPRPSRLT